MTLAPEESERLQVWLASNIGTDAAAPLAIDVISGGASNLTLGVRVGDRHVVVRRPPIGHFLPTAHDMGREYTVYRALHGTAVPVPHALAHCTDESVIGAPFYVMQHLDGIVPHDATVLAGTTAETNARLSERFVEILVAIHALDVDAVGLGDFAKREGYLARQVARWSDQWERSKIEDTPVIDDLGRLLRERMPQQLETTLVHGDYRLGNVMLDRTDAAVVLAVLDWEMATLGDPLSDLAYTLLYWSTTHRPLVHPSQAIADLPGFPTAGNLVARYEHVSGRSCEHLDFYIALAAYKLTIIGEGARARAIRTGRPDPFAGAERPLPEWALSLLSSH